MKHHLKPGSQEKHSSTYKIVTTINGTLKPYKIDKLSWDKLYVALTGL